jgi:AcrR family transcriptional regulator
VRGVCERARLSPRFFYESFTDRDALAIGVFDDVVGGITVRVLEAIDEAGEDPRERARAAFSTLVGVLSDDPRLGRVTLVEALGSEALARRRLAAMRTVADVIAEQGRIAYDTTAEVEPLLELTSLVLAGGLTELLIVWLDGGLATSAEQLVEDCVDLFVSTGDAAARVAARRAHAVV